MYNENLSHKHEAMNKISKCETRREITCLGVSMEKDFTGSLVVEIEVQIFFFHRQKFFGQSKDYVTRGNLQATSS